jgi:hypothetical protein
MTRQPTGQPTNQLTNQPTNRPTTRQSFLFFTLLTLALLTQIVVLRWGAEAVFFVTWLLLALTVRHDSRISAGVGLAFLATCPFLLIAEKDAVAEQAANYAYFFLAIGVLVQLEELFLERYACPEGGRRSWLDRKLDLSYLWQPLIQALRRRWTVMVGALGRQVEAADRANLARLVQIVGAAGLAIVFLVAAVGGARPGVILPLLGGAVLFPFVIWGLRIIVRALGPAWLLRVGLALVILPLAAAEMVWLYDLLQVNRLARMETVYDFNDNLQLAQRSAPLLEGETVETRVWTIEEEPKRVLYQHPAFSGLSRLAYEVEIGRHVVLAFDVAMAPESWQLEGDGVAFAVYIEGEQGAQQVFATYIDPKHDEADRCWHTHTVDLSAYAGQTVTITFETGTGPAGDERYDWAGWGEPKVLER